MHINERHTYIWAPQVGSAKRDPYADRLDLMVEHGSGGMVTGRETCKKPTQGFPYHLETRAPRLILASHTGPFKVPHVGANHKHTKQVSHSVQELEAMQCTC